MAFPVILLIALFVAGVIFALTAGRRLSRAAVRSFTALTVLLLGAIIFIWSRPTTSVAAVYVYAEILLYLLLPFAFTLPVTLRCWWTNRLHE
jgi:hypothetical protein